MPAEKVLRTKTVWKYQDSEPENVGRWGSPPRAKWSFPRPSLPRGKGGVFIFRRPGQLDELLTRWTWDWDWKDWGLLICCWRPSASNHCVRSPYIWIAPPVWARKKNDCRKTERATTIPRPPLENSWQGESKSAWFSFVNVIFGLFFQNNFPNIVKRKIVKAESDSPCRILVCRGLRSF